MKSLTTSKAAIVISLVLILAWLSVSIMIGTRRVRANNFTVTNASDCVGPGCGSLRQAILDANANPGADSIDFDEAATGTITLTMGELPPITDDLTITGPGVFALTIDGNHASRVFEINSEVTVNISGLTISNGTATTGGGILNQGTLTLTNAVVSGNSAFDGAGILNNTSSMLTITNSTLSGNSASIVGGGIWNNTSSILTITNSTLSGNSANDGGGIYNLGTGPATLTITNSTLSGNSATQGGGIRNGGTANISFTTLSGNSANLGGGIFNDSASTVNIKNSLVANSALGGDCSNLGGTWNATGKNFSTSAACPGFTQVPSTGPGGLNLGPLADNGGNTQTHALLPGSIAIDAAPDCTDVGGSSVGTDQRGIGRPQGSACDPGAYEFVPCTTTPTITCQENFSVSTDPDKCSAVVTYTPPPADCPCSGGGAGKPQRSKEVGVKPTTSPKQNESCSVVCSPAPGSTFPKGTTTVTCMVTDSFGNTAQCSFNITVNDTQPPKVSCPGNITQSTDPNQCSAKVNYTATANDNCDGPLTPTCSPPSGSTFQKGTTTVTCMATDSSQNTGSCSFTVTVVDTQPPTITCPADVMTSTAAASCPIFSGNVVTFPNPTTGDNCGVQSVVCNPPSGSVFPTGTTTVICTVTDTSGNTAMCSFNVNQFSFCLQDDSSSGNVVLVGAQSGDFSFCCGGVLIASGRGTLTARGCAGSIDQIKGNRKVHIEWDTAANNGLGAGTAFVQKGSDKTVCQITDRNMSNNTCQCSSPTPGAPTKPPKQKAF